MIIANTQPDVKWISLTPNSLSKPSSLLWCISLTWAGNSCLDIEPGSLTRASAFPSTVVHKINTYKRNFQCDQSSTAHTKPGGNTLEVKLENFNWPILSLCLIITWIILYIILLYISIRRYTHYVYTWYAPGVGCTCMWSWSFPSSALGSMTSVKATGSFSVNLFNVHGQGWLKWRNVAFFLCLLRLYIHIQMMLMMQFT